MLRVEHIMVFYENALAVNNVCFQCARGSITGLFGANSAGKSTLMYALSGIILDMKKKEEMRGGERIALMGEVRFNGSDISALPPAERARQGIILCPERRRIFPESTVLENLKIGGYLATRVQAKKTLEYVFSIFPALAELKPRLAGFLSGGEQQQLAIGRALMAQPTLLLLDEPLLGLSPSVEASLVRTIRTINQETGLTMLIAEQYARSVLPIIDHGFVMENGSLVLEGSSQELMENPDVKAAYFGV